MKYFLGLLFILFVCVFLISCSATKKIDTLKPLPTTDTITAYKNKISFIALPVELKLSEVEKQVNKNVTGLLYEDISTENNDVSVKIWKTKDIKIYEEKGLLISEIPLKILAQVKYGTNFLGLNDTRDINLDGVLVLESKANLSNWRLTTTSKVRSLKWSESPNIVIAGKKLPITYLINPAVILFKSKIAKGVDEAIDATCDFKSEVLNAMNELSKPLLTNDAYEAWFKINPIELYVTKAELKPDAITMNMGLKCTMLTMLGQKPKNNFEKENLVLKPISKMPENFTISVAAVSTYESASKIITKNFKGEEFGTGNRKVVVQNVSIWKKDTNLIIALDLLGSINGTIYLSGVPKYNSETFEIYFENLDYVLNTKSILMKSANWLAQGYILNKIKENCNYSIKENLDEGKKNMLPYLNNYSPMKGVFINGTMDNFVFEKVELNDQAIIAFITTTGKTQIKIDGME